MISDDLRLLVISEDHMTGTGACGAVVVLRCIDGQLKAVFHNRFENGADIGEATADKLVMVAKYGAAGTPIAVYRVRNSSSPGTCSMIDTANR